MILRGIPHFENILKQLIMLLAELDIQLKCKKMTTPFDIFNSHDAGCRNTANN